MNKVECDFCDEKLIDTQEIIRNNFVKVIYPKKPIIFEHVMIMPVRHIASLIEINNDEMNAIIKAISALKLAFCDMSGKASFNIFENDGIDAGQHVPHVHIHMFARSKDENISPYKVLNNPERYKLNSLSEIEMSESVAKLKLALQKYWMQ